MIDRTPLPGTGEGDRVVDALDALDERQQVRHDQQTTWLLRTIGGLAGALATVTLLAILIIGTMRGVNTLPLLQAVVEAQQ